jgi:hypothetical protein
LLSNLSDKRYLILFWIVVVWFVPPAMAKTGKRRYAPLGILAFFTLSIVATAHWKYGFTSSFGVAVIGTFILADYRPALRLDFQIMKRKSGIKRYVGGSDRLQSVRRARKKAPVRLNVKNRRFIKVTP